MTASTSGDLATQLLSVAVRGRRLLLAAGLAGSLLATGGSMLMTPVFTAHATFVADSKGGRLPSGIAGVAASFGLALGGSGAERSPDFYADLVRSEALIRRMLQARFRAPSGTDSLALLDLLDISGRDSADRVERGVRRLKRRLATVVDPRTGAIDLTVDMPTAPLARDGAAWILNELDRFNRDVRRTKGRQRREFLEQRAAAAKRRLDDQEDILRDFLERNRAYENSPAKRVDEARLRREVTLATEVASTVTRELEAARIEEVDDTPVLTVVDPPQQPVRPTWPVAWRMALLGAVFGPLAALSTLLGLEVARRSPWRQLAGQLVHQGDAPG